MEPLEEILKPLSKPNFLTQQFTAFWNRIESPKEKKEKKKLSKMPTILYISWRDSANLEGIVAQISLSQTQTGLLNLRSHLTSITPYAIPTKKDSIFVFSIGPPWASC